VLAIDAALGHPERAELPLLRSQAQAAPATLAEARALGERAAALLRDQGAAEYLASAA